jgi:D-serine deaminase-like pyridoxal phosphate-dependent protein
MLTIVRPTLLLDVERVRRNIRRMAEKAARLGLRFRPHFKTHQSIAVGRIFREFGVGAIAVSSVEMARYFAADGWEDILIAFPVNVLEIEDIRKLAERANLSLLTESPDSVRFLAESLATPVDLWIKINVGDNRAGVDWDDSRLLDRISAEAGRSGKLRLRGILSHNGRAYGAGSLDELKRVHEDSLAKLLGAKKAMSERGFGPLEISVGDTPSSSRLENFPGADEIRPGNFVLYDVMQLGLGSCSEDDVAAAVACPVVAVHPGRNEIVLHGGAIHLSGESVKTRDGEEIYGLVCLREGDGWGRALEGTAVTSVCQEHGIVRTTGPVLKRLKAGDVLVVLPVHSCLTVNLWKEYILPDGTPVPTMRACRRQ